MYLLTNYPTLHPTPRFRWIKQLQQIVVYKTETVHLPDESFEVTKQKFEMREVDVCIALLKPAPKCLESLPRDSSHVYGESSSIPRTLRVWQRRREQVTRYQKFHMFRMQTQQRDALSRATGDFRSYNQNNPSLNPLLQ